MSKLRFTFRVKEVDVESTDVCDKALAVINKWRQSSTCACISILRDALHKVGLQSIDDSVFGHIPDKALTKPEAGAGVSSLLGIPDLEGETSSTAGKGSVLVSHVGKLSVGHMR